MDINIVELSGWVPAFMFPLATLFQLYKIISLKSSVGVSALAWVGFGLANICLYIYAEKYDSPQAILAMLGQAWVDFAIAGAAVYFSKSLNIKDIN